jgi:outer membrane protein TolC
VQLQVTQAHIARQTAQLSLKTAQAAVDQSAESLRILRNRYSAGLATITDLLHAEDAERESQSNYWHAVYGNAVAYAQLLFATGTLTPDAAEELQ